MAASLTNLTEAERTLALQCFEKLRPFLEDKRALPEVAQQEGIPLRTARRWVSQYRQEGLAGLVRKSRSDKGKRRFSLALEQSIEGLALKKPRLSIATIHRCAAEMATTQGESPPSYSTVYALVKRLEPALITLAHEGAKAYSETFDLLHRREAEAPNAIWQADHTELDIYLLNEQGESQKPWLWHRRRYQGNTTHVQPFCVGSQA